jgi:hypothetical protein
MIRAVLAHDKLTLLSENDAFALAKAWISSQDFTGAGQRRDAFATLMPSLRFHYMTPDYLGRVRMMMM